LSEEWHPVQKKPKHIFVFCIFGRSLVPPPILWSPWGPIHTMLPECVFNIKMYERTYFNFTINNQEGFAKNLPIYETIGNHYEWQVTTDRQYKLNMQKKKYARKLE
jgi:hypothetical protein